jgi:hypothetical protein
MENQENTYQNPDPDPVSGQEENSSPVETTESTLENQPATDPGQTETPSTEEFADTLPALKEEHHEDHDEELTEEVAEHIAQEAGENFDAHTRAELVGLLKTAVEETDINTIKTRIALIKVAFLKKKKEENLQKYEQAPEEGSTREELEADQDELDHQFNEYFNIYKANKARFTEVLEKQKKENLSKKIAILEKLKLLCDSEETLKKTYDEFRSLQEQWKQVGVVPRSEINNLWQNYHFQVERFFEKVKLNKELKDLDLKKNLEAKMSICEKTEELLLETSIIKSFKRLQKLHEEWKEIGPVPADKKDEIWERFKNTTDKINDRRREHYTRIEEEQQNNLDTKTALCEQAEEVLTLKNESIRDWQEHTNKVNELLKIWKSIGPVPQKVNTSIWSRFKASLDSFFANKKEFFDKLKDQQVHNYNLKVELCVQAEGLKSSTDWKKTTNELIRLQNEWKNIGPVPKKHSDKIWKRFRSACDDFFNAKGSYFSNIHSHEEENLALKLGLMNKLKEHPFTENKAENLEILKNFQREWTDIGHIPIKEKDKLQNEFRALVNEQLDRLKISEVEMSAATFQTRIEQIRSDPQSKKILFRERELLSSRVSKMRDDINLWENNIGFLANSKNAAILKAEFEQKINKAKSDLKVMEAKLKILRAQG